MEKSVAMGSCKTWHPLRWWQSLATLATLAVLLALLPTPALADPPLKIGVVSIERIFRESSAALAAQKKLEREFSGREQELQRLNNRVQALQAALAHAGSGLSTADRQAKERELAGANLDFQRAQRDMMQQLDVRKNQEIVALNERIKKILVNIAQREHFDLILHEGVYYAVPRIDLTDRVIRALGSQ